MVGCEVVRQDKTRLLVKEEYELYLGCTQAFFTLSVTALSLWSGLSSYHGCLLSLCDKLTGDSSSTIYKLRHKTKKKQCRIKVAGMVSGCDYVVYDIYDSPAFIPSHNSRLEVGLF